MAVYRTSAPGKIILHGEHAAVYGKTALAVSLGIRTRAVVREQPGRRPETLRLALEDLSDEAVVFDLEDVAERVTKRAEGLRFELSSPEALYHDRFVGLIRAYVEERHPRLPEASARAVVVALYALCALAECTSCRLASADLTVKSELELGSGAGSSASFAVAVVAAALCYVRANSPGYALSADFGTFGEAEKRAINGWAFACEKISHGAPSGVDNSVCTYGSLVEFRKGGAPVFRRPGIPLRACLVNTRVKRNTEWQVRKVAELRIRHGDVTDKLMEACDAVALSALAVVCEPGEESVRSSYRKLSELFRINHQLLRALGVSHSSLEKVCETAAEFGYDCKLTGAGGGGFAVVPVPPGEDVEPMIARFRALGFEARVADLGGCGVKVDAE